MSRMATSIFFLVMFFSQAITADKRQSAGLVDRYGNHNELRSRPLVSETITSRQLLSPFEDLTDEQIRKREDEVLNRYPDIDERQCAPLTEGKLGPMIHIPGANEVCGILSERRKRARDERRINSLIEKAFKKKGCGCNR